VDLQRAQRIIEFMLSGKAQNKREHCTACTKRSSECNETSTAHEKFNRL
jgi:hypothetical protein